jgi:hypothetical protein
MRHRRIPIAIYVLVALALPAVATDKDDKDKSKPIRHELEQEYAKLEAAMERNDTEAVLAFHLPDFRGEDCRGNTYPPEINWSRIRNYYSPTHAIEVSFTLGTIEPKGEDEALVTVHRTLSRTQPMRDGNLHRVDTVQTHDDAWVRTPEGWRLRSSLSVREFAWYVDGKRVEKGMPWDPDAPPYVPPEEKK